MDNDKVPEHGIASAPNADTFGSIAGSDNIDADLDAAIAATSTPEPVKQETSPPPEPVKQEPATQPQAPVQTPVAEPTKQENAASAAEPTLDSLQEPRNISPTNLNHWKTLRSIAEKAQNRVKELEPKIAELQASIEAASKQTAPPVDMEEYESLRHLRMVVEAASDPEFQSKFNTPIQNLEKDIRKILVDDNGLDPKTFDEIQSKGFALSNSALWQSHIYANLDENTAFRLKNKLAAWQDAVDAKGAAAAEWQQKGQEFFKQREEKLRSEHETYQRTMQSYAEDIRAKFPEAQRKDLATAKTPEEKAAFEAHNKQVDLVESRFASALNPSTPQGRVQTAVAACLAFKLNEDVKALHAELVAEKQKASAMEAELAKIRGAGSAIKKSPTPVKSAEKTEIIKGFSPRMNASRAFDAAFDAHFNEAGGV